MPEREDGTDGTAARPAIRARLRASNADREHVIGLLKDAFVQDRLTKDEFDARVGQAFAARTDADLAALSADLPAAPARVKPPWRPENTSVKNSARVIAATTVLTAGAWVGALLTGSGNQVVGALAATLAFIWLGLVCLFGSVLLDARRQRRSGRPLPGTPRCCPGHV
jgi:hypothetical protein